jgi:hypothetical protein
MLGVSEIITLKIEDSYAYIQTPVGKSIHIFLIGLVLGGRWGLSIVCWIIYWVLAVVYLALYFCDVELARPLMATGEGTWSPHREEGQGEQGALVKPVGGGSYAPLE